MLRMSGLFDGTPWERPVTCAVCERPRAECQCPRDAEGRVCRPQDQPARVGRERRKGGGWATVVTGLDAHATDCAALLKRLRQTLATGGTVRGATIELQGDHRDRVVAILRELGYPAKPTGG